MRRPALSHLNHRLGDAPLAARCPGEDLPQPQHHRGMGSCCCVANVDHRQRDPPSGRAPGLVPDTHATCHAWLPYSSLAAASVWLTATYQMLCWQPPAAGLRHDTTQALALHANNESTSWLATGVDPRHVQTPYILSKYMTTPGETCGAGVPTLAISECAVAANTGCCNWRAAEPCSHHSGRQCQQHARLDLACRARRGSLSQHISTKHLTLTCFPGCLAEYTTQQAGGARTQPTTSRT